MELLLALLCVIGSQDRTTTIDRLKSDAVVGTDDRFKKDLQKGQLSSFHSAPADFRKILASFKLVRWELVQGFRHERGRAILTWWSSEIGVEGKAAEVRHQLIERFKERGFDVKERDDNGTVVLACGKSEKGIVQRVVLSGPNGWTGGRKVACGFSMAWEVRDMRKSLPPSLKQMFQGLPVLKNYRLKDRFVKSLQDTNPSSVTVGGPWTGSYEWSGLFSGEEGKSLARLLGDLGYKLDRKEKGYALYSGGVRGGFAYLHDPDKDGRVRLRIALK